jgi:hypothetical protein
MYINIYEKKKKKERQTERARNRRKEKGFIQMPNAIVKIKNKKDK